MCQKNTGEVAAAIAIWKCMMGVSPYFGPSTNTEFKHHLEILSPHTYQSSCKKTLLLQAEDRQDGLMSKTEKYCDSVLYYPPIPQCQYQGLDSNMNANIR